MSDGPTEQPQINHADETDFDQTKEVVRSEEVLSVGLSTQVSERVVIRKRVVIETVTQVVERRREELVIERYPAEPEQADPTDHAGSVWADARGSALFTDTDYEIVLFEEQIVITKQVVPVERIALGTRTVTDVLEVSDDVRREQIDLITDADPPATTE